MRFSIGKCKLSHLGTCKLKYKYYQRRIKQCESEIVWDVILSSRTVRILLYEKAENFQTEGTLALYAKPSVVLLNKMPVYFSTPSFLEYGTNLLTHFLYKTITTATTTKSKREKKPEIFFWYCSKEQVPLKWDRLLELGGQCLPLFSVLKFA